MASLKVAWKERSRKLRVSLNKSWSNLFGYLKCPSKIKTDVRKEKVTPGANTRIDSWQMGAPVISKIKTDARKEKVTPGANTWIDSWQMGAPVISASEEFYGLPQYIVFLIWTFVLGSQYKPHTYRVEPSYIQSVFHSTYLKIDMTGARALLQVNRLARGCALEKFKGTLPMYAGEGKTPGIFRFHSEKDLIYIADFVIINFQMNISNTTCPWRKNKAKWLFDLQVEECLEFYPGHYQIAKRRWSEKMPKKLEREENKMSLPTQTWNLCQSIQNLVVFKPHYGILPGGLIDRTICPDHAEHEIRFGPRKSRDLFLEKGVQTLGIIMGYDDDDPDYKYNISLSEGELPP